MNKRPRCTSCNIELRTDFKRLETEKQIANSLFGLVSSSNFDWIFLFEIQKSGASIFCPHLFFSLLAATAFFFYQKSTTFCATVTKYSNLTGWNL